MKRLMWIDPPACGREVVFDSETTGMKVDWTHPERSDRVVEVGCLELMNKWPTGRSYHAYVNPERDVPSEATAVHGLTQTFLKDYPTFDKIADDLLNFFADSPIVIHNATFDVRFLEYEYSRLGKQDRFVNPIVDTLPLARKRFRGSSVSLDALCKRFEIDLSGRVKHGALIDAELLARVYFELTGGAQPSLISEVRTEVEAKTSGVIYAHRAVKPRTVEASDQQAHKALRQKLVGNLWSDG